MTRKNFMGKLSERLTVDDFIRTVERIKKIERAWEPAETAAIVYAQKKLTEIAVENIKKGINSKLGGGINNYWRGNYPHNWCGNYPYLDRKKELTDMRNALSHCGKIDLSERLSSEDIEKAIQFYSKNMPEEMRTDLARFHEIEKKYFPDAKMPKKSLSPDLHRLIDDIQGSLKKVLALQKHEQIKLRK